MDETKPMAIRKLRALEAGETAREIRGPVTSYDVAVSAGVSQSAVSRCFTPGASIAPATRKRVLAAATKLGYQPNALAQGLISRRTNLIAVLISKATSLYYPEFLGELSEKLAAAGMRTLLFTFPAQGDGLDVLTEVWRHRVDGVISAVQLNLEQIRIFTQRATPVIFYNRRSDSEGLASSICCDSAAGERLLIDRLIESGHRRFGLIAGPEASFIGEERLQGALRRLAETGHADVPIARGSFSYASGQQALAELLTREAALDAIVATNDMMALGAIDTARAHFARAVPGDLSIVGFDGIEQGQWSNYQLTSIEQPIGPMTEAAVNLLMHRIENPSAAAEKRLFAGRLIMGASARLGAP